MKRNFSHGSPEQMIQAFENKIAELQDSDAVESSTNVTDTGVVDTEADYITSSNDAMLVDIDPGDDEIVYVDNSGGFGEVGEELTLQQIKEYWNNNYDGDPSLEQYDSFESWWSDTRQWLSPVYSSTEVTAASANLDELDPAYIERYLHTLIGDVESALNDAGIVEHIIESGDGSGDAIYITIPDNGFATEFAVPEDDLTWDFDQMKKDVNYIVNEVKNQVKATMEKIDGLDAVESADTVNSSSSFYALLAEDESPILLFEASDIDDANGQVADYNNLYGTNYSAGYDDAVDTDGLDLVGRLSDEGNIEGFAGPSFTEIASKQVPDSDGFLTDYTMYRDTETGEYVFVFGDKDIYKPEQGDFDWSCDTEEEAWDWYNDYTGFADGQDSDDDDDDIYSSEAIQDAVTASYSPDVLEELVAHYSQDDMLSTEEIWDEIMAQYNDEDLANDVIEAL